MSPWLPSIKPLPACRLPPVTQGVPAPTLIGCELLKSEPSRAVMQCAQEFPAKRRDYTLKTGSVNSVSSTPACARGWRIGTLRQFHRVARCWRCASDRVLFLFALFAFPEIVRASRRSDNAQPRDAPVRAGRRPLRRARFPRIFDALEPRRARLATRLTRP